MNRRQYAAVVLGSTALAGAAVARVARDGSREERPGDGDGDGVRGQTGTETPFATPTETAQPSEPPTETATPSDTGAGFGPRTFSGTGTATSEEFDLGRGPITAAFSVEGDASFTAQLLAVEGERYDDVSLATLLAPVEGSQVAAVDVAGPHVLNVETDGAWELTLAQPTATTGRSLPVEVSGSGPAYVDLVAFDGVTRAGGSHEGSSNYIVETVPLDPDEFGELVFNEIGRFEGTTTVRVDGPSYVNVDADGDWTLSFEA
ncbi:hypothetical protein [Halobaculum lipolyticum]|uniref:DUF4382 domain-containing protein n=1 Tax=Halobaculum lipolyticum TaxID=3032001 RepID=A0ABD5WFK3_9EURY|nr:hypothetical protein [Halobaculum sp. DT31]